VEVEIPAPLRASSRIHENWHDVQDEEVLDLLGIKEQK